MRIVAAAFVLALVVACTGGGDSTGAGDGGASSSTSSGSTSSASSSSGSNATSSSGGSSSGGSSGGTIDSGPSCVTKSVVIGTGGTTSSCGFAFTEMYDFGKVNVRFEPGGAVCARFDGQCGATGGGPGWWFGSGEIDLCDNSCTGIDTPGVKLVVDLGCPTVYCTN